jgi:hypothetical protein
MHLIIITGPGGKLDLFSAHYIDTDATTMRDRLSSILTEGMTVHMIEVPETEGVVQASEKPVQPAKPVKAPTQQETAPLPPAAPAQPFRRLSAEQFEEETRSMLENGGMTFRDADSPLGEGGAFS